MKSHGKNLIHCDLNLEDDLLIDTKDMAYIRKKRYQSKLNLEEYLDFLEQMGAFRTKKVKTRFYEDIFEL